MRRTINGSRFDTTLDLGNTASGYHATLTIHMKVCLQQFRPPQGHAMLQYAQSTAEHSSDIIITPWPPGNAWSTWCRRFEVEAEAFFDGRLWLEAGGPWIGSAPVPGSGGRSRYRPGVRCGFRISRVPMSESHFVVDVAHTDSSSDFFRSFQNQHGAVDEATRALQDSLNITDDPQNLSTLYRACFAGSGRLMLSDGDLDHVSRRWPRDPAVPQTHTYRQRIFLHELGHGIGLGHVNGAGNATDAYGATAHQYGDLMGGGERIEPWHAFPWKRRLSRHLNAREGPARWTATITRPAVTTDRHYPSPNRPMPSGGVGTVPLDGGVATNCPTRGRSQWGPEGMV